MKGGESTERVAVIRGCFWCGWKRHIGWRAVCVHEEVGCMQLCPEKLDILPGFLHPDCPLMSMEEFGARWVPGPPPRINPQRAMVPLPMAPAGGMEE